MRSYPSKIQYGRKRASRPEATPMPEGQPPAQGKDDAYGHRRAVKLLNFLDDELRQCRLETEREALLEIRGVTIKDMEDGES